MYQSNGLWFYLLALRQIVVPVIIFLYIYPALAWHSQEILIGGLVYYIVMAALFFLRKKAFVILYIAQAAAVTALLFYLLYNSPTSQNAKLLIILIVADVSFILFLFTSRQAAVAFQTRRLEIVDHDTKFEDLQATYSRGGRLKNRLISAAIAVAIVAVVISVQQASPNPSFNADPSSQYYKRIKQEVIDQINSQYNTFGTASPSGRSSSPQESTPTSQPPMYNPKYDVLRRGAVAPAPGSYDPLKLTYNPSCLGEDMDVILYNLDPDDYTTAGFYEFYPKFDYLGLGWETNQVQMVAQQKKAVSLTYSAQSLSVTKPVEFLYAAETMYDQIVDAYGKPTQSNYIQPDNQKTSSMQAEEALAAMRKGERGTCSLVWELTGLRVRLNISNQHMGPKTGRYELTFESK